MEQEEALKKIAAEYPEFTKDAIQIIQDKGDLTELLKTLEACY
jgi:hypothetical protein